MYNPKLHFHFIGIGGSGMSGIAEILLNQGFKVSGSDKHISGACLRLKKLGAEISEGHSADNINPSISTVVFSSAIPAENAELIAAREKNIRCIRRAAVLAELVRLKYSVAVAGSHGKTSTTSMIAAVMEKDLDPTVIVGGIARSYGSTSKLGNSDYLVAESDESDKSFLLLKPTIAVVTNIDLEHLSAYSSFAELEEAFHQFVSEVPFYGLSILGADNPHVRKLLKRIRGRTLTYGVNPDVDLQAVFKDISEKGTRFDVIFKNKNLGEINLPLLGKHFMQNALAAVAVGLEFGIDYSRIQEALNSFQGVERRVEIIGKPKEITVINDYAHHPTEISASLLAIREALIKNGNKLHLLFQPHRYSRTQECFQEFKDCFQASDCLLVSDIYSAGEKPISGIDSKSLCSSITHSNCRYIPELNSCAEVLKSEVHPGDVLVCMGAGSIGSFAHDIVKELNG